MTQITRQLFIDGEWQAASAGRTIDVINPATEEAIAVIASAEQADVDTAVEAARAALDGSWSKLTARDRERLLWKIGERLTERIDEIAQLETLHNGKPISESLRESAFSTTPGARTSFRGRPFPSGATTSPIR
jgi:acyl-CoA reductase-like NAD-dependent aldehyde dehydrogenase